MTADSKWELATVLRLETCNRTGSTLSATSTFYASILDIELDERERERERGRERERERV